MATLEPPNPASAACRVPQCGFTVLVVDDDEADAHLLRYVLEEIYPNLQFVHSPTIGEARSILSTRDVHMVFIDYRIGNHSGLDFLGERRAEGDLQPFVFVTGQGDERLATNALHAGADEYVCKSDLSPQRVSRAVSTAFAHSEKRRVEKQNQQLVQELQVKNKLLEENGRRLAELYETAHHFVNDVSHEFRTPLTVIKEFASIIKDGLGGPTSKDQNEYLEIILDRADDLGTMIEDMLDMSKLEAGLLGVRRKPCHIQDILKDLYPTLQQKASLRKIQIELQVDQSEAIYCDPEKIKRITVNLVMNAIKFSPEEGRIVLSARNRPEEGDVMVSVRDDGPGIHPESKELLFERFAQVGTPNKTAIKGYGLGLNICKELVHLNFGDIGVESEIRKGSTFWFTIPMFKPVPLIRRYLNCVKAFRDDVAFVSLAVARTQTNLPQSAGEAAELFLHQHVRKSDLIFSLRPCEWLLVLASSQMNIENVFRRFQGAWSQALRNNPLSQAITMDFEKKGCWSVEDQLLAFIRQFESFFDSSSDSHA